MKQQRTPVEFSRRTRALSDGLKAEEFRNLAIFFFPCVMDELREPACKKLLAAMSYLMRMYNAPDAELAQEQERRKARLRFLQLVKEWMGRDAFSYNFHTFTHLERLRAHGPVSETSGKFNH